MTSIVLHNRQKNGRQPRRPGKRLRLGGGGRGGGQYKIAEHFTFCEEEIAELLPKKHSKNTTRRMTSAIWRISTTLNIPLYPEGSEKKENEDENLTSIEVSMF